MLALPCKGQSNKAVMLNTNDGGMTPSNWYASIIIGTNLTGVPTNTGVGWKLILHGNNLVGVSNAIAAKQSGSITLSNLIAMGITNIVAGTNAIIYTNNGTLVVNGTGGGGSQTPWTSDIDADGFSLSGFNTIQTMNHPDWSAGIALAMYDTGYAISNTASTALYIRFNMEEGLTQFPGSVSFEDSVSFSSSVSAPSYSGASGLFSVTTFGLILSQIAADSRVLLLKEFSSHSTTNFFEVRDTANALRVSIDSNHVFRAESIITSNIVQSPAGFEVGVPYRLFAMTNLVTVTNVTAATSLITNSLKGTNWIPANCLASGSSIRIKGYGYLTSASATPTTFGLRLGNSTMAATNVWALATTLVNDFTGFDLQINVKTNGASGSFIVSGFWLNQSGAGSATAIAGRRLANGLFPTPISVDTTAPILLDIFALPGATTHGITLLECMAEIIP